MANDIVFAVPKVVVGTQIVNVESTATAARIGAIKLTDARISVNVEYLDAGAAVIAETQEVFVGADYEAIVAAQIGAEDAGKGFVQMYEKQIRKAVKTRLALEEAP